MDYFTNIYHSYYYSALYGKGRVMHREHSEYSNDLYIISHTNEIYKRTMSLFSNRVRYSDYRNYIQKICNNNMNRNFYMCSQRSSRNRLVKNNTYEEYYCKYVYSGDGCL